MVKEHFTAMQTIFHLDFKDQCSRFSLIVLAIAVFDGNLI